MRVLAFALLLCAATSARGAEKLPPPLQPTEIRVSVANKSQKALGLHALPAGAGWRLDLAADADSVDIIDLTPGTPARTTTLPVVARRLRFDAMRFAAGHVYRVQARLAGKLAALTLVYLYPDAVAAPRHRGTERVKFAPDDNAKDDVTPNRIDKGAL